MPAPTAIRIRWYYETIRASLVLAHGYARGVRRWFPQGRAHTAREVLTKRPAHAAAARCFLAR